MADEPGYVPVPPRLMVEQTVMTDEGKRPDEVRLFVFDGKVAVANTVFVEDTRIRNGAFHTRDWVRLDWHFSRVVDREFSRPRRLSDMIRIGECLGAYWRLSDPLRRALTALLFGRREIAPIAPGADPSEQAG
jgi:TupA-like ATPgrasp